MFKVVVKSLAGQFEVKEENIYGDDVLLARGRLTGALQELIEQSEEDSVSTDDDNRKTRHHRSAKKKDSDSSSRKLKRRRSDTGSPGGTGTGVVTAFHHTYVMKLFDRSVDLARYEEDTPLYPICRAWMANQPRNPQLIVKRRVSTPDPELDRSMNSTWSADRIHEMYQLPTATEPPISRVPSPLPEQQVNNLEEPCLNYDDRPPVPRDELIRNHLQRWAKVKHKWIAQANKNEERFEPSFNILTTIYNKAQENME
ncbi:Myb-interacting protein 40 [Carabus blaptoides fortunei]